MKTVYFRIVLAAVAAAIAASAQVFPQYASVLNALAAFLGGVSIPAESVQKAVKAAPKAAVMLLICALTFPSLGCAGGLPAILQEVNEYISDGSLLITALHAAYEFFLVSSGVTLDPAVKAKIDQAFVDVSLSLDSSLRATRGAEELSENDVDAAFADFKAAYTSLVDLLDQVGAIQKGKAGAFFASRNGQVITRVPLAFRK